MFIFRIFLFIITTTLIFAQEDSSTQLLPKFDLANSNIPKDFNPDKEEDSFATNKKMMLQYLKEKTQCIQNATNQEQLSQCQLFQSTKHEEHSQGKSSQHKRSSF